MGESPVKQSALEKRIRKKIAEFAGKKITLREFNDWFMPVSWNTSKQDIRTLELTIHAVELLYEFDDDLLTTARLRRALANLLET